MQRLIQIVLVAWFLTISLFLFVPSFLLLRGGTAVPAFPQPPAQPPVTQTLANPPVDPKIEFRVLEELGKTYGQQVTLYTQQVAAYKEHLNAYKAYIDVLGKRELTGPYQLVVKDTLSTLLSTFATALLGYVFIRGGAGLLNNVLLLRKGQPPHPIDI